MFKPIEAKVNGEIVRVPQRVLFIQQLIKAGITGGAPAKKLVLQFMEQHEFGEARRRSQTWFGVPDCGTVWLRPFPRTLLIGVSGAQYGAAVALQGSPARGMPPRVRVQSALQSYGSELDWIDRCAIGIMRRSTDGRPPRGLPQNTRTGSSQRSASGCHPAALNLHPRRTAASSRLPPSIDPCTIESRRNFRIAGGFTSRDARPHSRSGAP